MKGIDYIRVIFNVVLVSHLFESLKQPCSEEVSKVAQLYFGPTQLEASSTRTLKQHLGTGFPTQAPTDGTRVTLPKQHQTPRMAFGGRPSEEPCIPRAAVFFDSPWKSSAGSWSEVARPDQVSRTVLKWPERSQIGQNIIWYSKTGTTP